MNKRIDHGTKIQGTRNSAIKLRRLITTIDGECPECASHSLIKYVDYEAITGCLVCGWKKIDSFIQPFY